MINNNTVEEAIIYAQKVINHEIVAGEFIVLSCKRFLSDISENSNYYLDKEKVNHCLQFLNSLKHYTGSHANKPFYLLDFQVFIVANVVGIYDKKTNERKYTESYIEMSRKQGKSFFAGALCMYFLICDNQASAEVLLLANSREQAKEIDFAIVSQLASQLDKKKKKIAQYRDSLYIKKTNSKLKVLSTETASGDGYNCSFGLIDEYHEAPNSAMKDLITGSQGMRKNAHCMVITTAGFSKDSVCYSLRETCIDVLKNIKTDDTLFSAIFELDSEEEAENETYWKKCAPALGETVSIKYLKDKIQKAKNTPSEAISIYTKNFNLWCSTAESWLPDKVLTDSMLTTVDISKFDDYDTILYVGVDLAENLDMTAVTYLKVDDGGKYYFKTLYYMPDRKSVV